MESKFIREIGVDQESGLTIGKVPIFKRTGIVKDTTEVSKKSSLSNEAVHILVLTKSLIGKTNIYSPIESLQVLNLKMQSLVSFSGRLTLNKNDKIVYWATYALLEILETKYQSELDLIENSKLFIQSLERFMDLEFNEEPSVLDHYFLPYLDNE